MPKSQEDTQDSNIMHGLKTKAKHHINASACLLMLVPCSQSTVDADQAMKNKMSTAASTVAAQQEW